MEADQAAVDTGTSELLASLDAGVLTLTLNRPAARNALTEPMVRALADQLARAETDPRVRCIVLTGAGPAFCAGGDVREMARTGDGTVGAYTLDEAIHRQRLAQRATAGKLFTMPKPTIAAINGPAAGAGLALSLACDVRIMSDATFLTTAFARVGFSGDYGCSYFLTHLVGTAKARELFFLSDRIDADEALRLGLVNTLCPEGEIGSQAAALAARLAVGPGVAYRYMKENLHLALTADVFECLDADVPNHLRCGQTEDHREAARAFVEKRVPLFQSR